MTGSVENQMNEAAWLGSSLGEPPGVCLLSMSITAVLLLLACSGGCKTTAPETAVPNPAASLQGLTAQREPRVLVPQRLPLIPSPQVMPVGRTQTNEVQLASHEAPQQNAPVKLTSEVLSEHSKAVEAAVSTGTYPIDLANALAMGGASSLQIQLAREKVIEAQSEYLLAKATWLPSLRAGVGFNRHDGRIQATEGDVIKAPRNSLFVGGGAGLGNTPLGGGSGGPPRLFVTLSLADVLFKPRVAGQMLDAHSAGESATTNNALMQIAVAYFHLVEAHGLRANALAGETATDEMVRLATLFAREGEGSEAEVDRAKTEHAHWRQQVEEAARKIALRNAELRMLLRLDPHLTLVPVEEKVTPIELIASDCPVESLISQGLSTRPELAQYQSVVEAAIQRLQQENWRPWLPNLQAGASGGSFGGGRGDAFDREGGRSDVDLLAVWEWEHLGLGNLAKQNRRSSQMRQAQMHAEMIRDRIIMEISTAASDVANYRRQLEIARQSVTAAGASFERNLARVREAEGLPIELLQAIRARTAAQDAYTKAVSDYNRAQYHLLRAVGSPPNEGDQEVPAETVPALVPEAEGEINPLRVPGTPAVFHAQGKPPASV